MAVTLVAGVLSIVVGLYDGVRYGGWAWAAVPVGLVSVTMQGAVLSLDPLGGPRRGVHGVLRQRREATQRARSRRLAPPKPDRSP